MTSSNSRLKSGRLKVNRNRPKLWTVAVYFLLLEVSNKATRRKVRLFADISEFSILLTRGMISLIRLPNSKVFRACDLGHVNWHKNGILWKSIQSGITCGELRGSRKDREGKS